jgi:hypothetical protein
MIHSSLTDGSSLTAGLFVGDFVGNALTLGSTSVAGVGVIGLFVGGVDRTLERKFVGGGGVGDGTAGVGTSIGVIDEKLVDPSITKALQNATSSRSIRCCSKEARRRRCADTRSGVATTKYQHQTVLKAMILIFL